MKPLFAYVRGKRHRVYAVPSAQPGYLPPCSECAFVFGAGDLYTQHVDGGWTRCRLLCTACAPLERLVTVHQAERIAAVGRAR